MARTGACAILAGLGILLGGCGARDACNGVACMAACPRDAARDSSGRCACTPGQWPVLGACVPPAVGDAYCGPAAKAAVDGCVFRQCAEGEVLDLATGACIHDAATAAERAMRCEEGAAPVVAEGHAMCVLAEAACPRGTRRVGAACARPPRCPPGSLASGGGCQPVVTSGGRAITRVDIGAWTALVLGPSGGPGNPDLCLPLALRPDAFGLPPNTAGVVSMRIAIRAPDEDMTRVYAHTEAQLTTSKATRPASAAAAGKATPSETTIAKSAEAADRPTPSETRVPESAEAADRLAASETTLPVSAAAAALVDSAVATLVEPLRALGGETSTAALEMVVRCGVGSL